MRLVQITLLCALALMPAVLLAQDVAQVSSAGMRAILAPPLRPPPLGDPHGDVTVVEYFDYNCPVCRETDPELRGLVKSDAHVRLVYKDLPIFGAVSVYAAYCALAAADLGHYEAAHRALIGSRQPLDSDAAVEAALREAGLDVAAIRADIAAHRQQFSAMLTRNREEADALSLKGTPGLLIGNELIDGGLQWPDLKRLVDAARRLHAIRT